jgi:hypothetical protein
LVYKFFTTSESILVLALTLSPIINNKPVSIIRDVKSWKKRTESHQALEL